MGIVGFIVIALAVVFGLAIAYDLRARRRRNLSAEFKESGRLNSRRAARRRDSAEARTRPTSMGGPPSGQGGPSLGP